MATMTRDTVLLLLFWPVTGTQFDISCAIMVPENSVNATVARHAGKADNIMVQGMERSKRYNQNPLSFK